MDTVREVLAGLSHSLNHLATLRLLCTVKEMRSPVAASMTCSAVLFLGHFLLYWGLLAPALESHPVLQRLFTSLYYLLWVFPVYCFSFILNTFWYSDVATCVFTTLHRAPKATNLSFVQRAAFELKRDLLMGSYVLQITILSVFPYSWPLVLPALSWLYSYYCFEYRWTLEAKAMPACVAALEGNWAYYLGFGLPFTTVTYLVPGLMGSGLWALLFPFFLVTGMTARPPTTQRKRLAVFSTSQWVVGKVEQWLAKKLD